MSGVNERGICRQSIVVAVGDQVSCELGDETVILHLVDGVYYSLDAVGTRIWDLCQDPKVVGEILRDLLTEYEVDENRCERELVALLEELVAWNLIEVKNVAAVT